MLVRADGLGTAPYNEDEDTSISIEHHTSGESEDSDRGEDYNDEERSLCLYLSGSIEWNSTLQKCFPAV